MVNYKKLVLKAITKMNALAGTKLPLLVKTLMLLAILRSVFGHIRVAKMVNYRKLVLKATTKRNALAGTNRQFLVQTLMLFGHFEVHFWSYEGSESCKLKES